MKVAAVQFAPVFKDKQANLASVVALATTAAEAGAKLIVLPELCTTGYSFMSYSDARPYAEEVEQYPNGWSRSNPPGSLFAMQKLVDTYGVGIAWGIASIGGVNRTNTLYNTQVFLYPGGFKHYNKLNFYGNDYLWATPGTESPPIVTWNGKRIGLMVCADIRDKSDEIDDFYEKGDADIVAFSANFGSGAFPSKAWMKFVKRNQMTLVVSNRYGQEVNNDFGFGGVCVIDPTLKVHCDGLRWKEPCIVYADVP